MIYSEKDSLKNLSSSIKNFINKEINSSISNNQNTDDRGSGKVRAGQWSFGAFPSKNLKSNSFARFGSSGNTTVGS